MGYIDLHAIQIFTQTLKQYFIKNYLIIRSSLALPDNLYVFWDDIFD